MDSYAGNEEISVSVFLPTVAGNEERKSCFGEYSDLDMLISIKELALDPCNPQVSQSLARSLWHQTLRVRKVMALSGTEFPRRKRKLQQFLREKLLPAHNSTPGTFNRQRVSKQSNKQISRASSASCLLNLAGSNKRLDSKNLAMSSSSTSLLTSEDNLPEKIELSHLTIAGGCNSLMTCCLAESDESANGSNLGSPKNLAIDDLSLMDLDDSMHSSISSNCVCPKPVRLMTPEKSMWFFNLTSDQVRRKVVPIGPRFQADVLEWNGLTNEEYRNDNGILKWLANQIWPLKGTLAETGKGYVGKGRSASCPCVSPGSVDCTRRHILQQRVLLQSELGPAFFSWKLDEMGEEFCKSWSTKELKSFESLAKAYPPTLGENFLKHAQKCLSSKGKWSIVNFYFNVYLPNRMGLQIRSSLKQVDSDDDEVEDIDPSDLRNRSKGASAKVGSSKGVNRYLRWHS